MRIVAAALFAVALLAVSANAKPSGNSNSNSGSAGISTHPTASADSDVARDKRGKLSRSATAKAEFKRQQPCPATGRSKGACPGYVIDHIQPLKRGGSDHPSNMQWQTKEAAKAKDKTE